VADPGAVEGPRCRAGIPAGDFYSRYQAAVWSIISARRARQQGIPMRKRPSEANGVGFDLAGERTLAVATPSRLLAVEAVPGLPADGPTPPGSPS
jgi:DNA-3-methyladenine glycosylase II